MQDNHLGSTEAGGGTRRPSAPFCGRLRLHDNGFEAVRPAILVEMPAGRRLMHTEPQTSPTGFAIVGWKRMHRISLQDFADVGLSNGLTIYDVSVLVVNDKARVSPPSKPSVGSHSVASVITPAKSGTCRP
jgi:hypothetical protein